MSAIVPRRIVPIVGESARARQAFTSGVQMTVRETACAEIFQDYGASGVPEGFVARRLGARTDSGAPYYTPGQVKHFITAYHRGRVERARAEGNLADEAEFTRRLAVMTGGAA